MSKANPYQHVPAGAVSFGPGIASALLEQRPLRKAARIGVISDAGVKAAGILDKVTGGLAERVTLVDTDVRPDGDVVHVDALADRGRAAQVDAWVAVGGGSVIDTAKGVNVVMALGGSLRDHEGYAKVRARLGTLVCVPTTAGTGSEGTQFAVVLDRAAKRKVILIDQSLVPTLGVLDPSLLVSLPPEVTAATAVDALTHAVEALSSRMRQPFGTALALEAVRLLIAEEALARSLAAPDDLAARGDTLSAASLAGQAASASMLGACHAFAHALGAGFSVPHGVANGLFLPSIMRFNLPRALGPYAALGRALGGRGATSALAEHAIAEVARFIHDVAGIPRQLRAFGVTEADLPQLAEATLADPDLATNPVQLQEPARALEVLQACL